MNVESSLRRNKPQVTRSSAGRILGFLGITRAYVRSLDTQEEEASRVNLPLDYSDWKPSETALLEAERQKAKVIMQLRRHLCMH